MLFEELNHIKDNNYRFVATKLNNHSLQLQDHFWAVGVHIIRKYYNLHLCPMVTFLFSTGMAEDKDWLTLLAE